MTFSIKSSNLPKKYDFLWLLEWPTEKYDFLWLYDLLDTLNLSIGEANVFHYKWIITWCTPAHWTILLTTISKIRFMRIRNYYLIFPAIILKWYKTEIPFFGVTTISPNTPRQRAEYIEDKFSWRYLKQDNSVPRMDETIYASITMIIKWEI